jgi:UDP-arabinose 4-epimerase
MRILVTGGAGYVGGHCCKALARAGWEVVVYDNLSRGWRDFVRWGRLIEADILDLEALRAAMAEVRPDAVAHFAALSEAGESMKAPARYYRTNVQGALNLLDCMREFEVEKLVFSSTCASYGLPLFLPITETHPQWPINPYGWSKLMVERLLADYGRAHGLRYVALRYFNAAGADAGGDIGERHEPETHLIPLILRAALDPSFPFTVLGDDFDTPDGTAIRDYVHVTDLAEAHCLALQYLDAGGASDAFNLGSGAGSSVLEVAAAAERAVGKPIARQIGPRRPGDPARLIADSAKAKTALGWRAKHPGLDDIIASALAWHARDNPSNRKA